MRLINIKEIVVCIMSYVASDTLNNCTLALPDVFDKSNHHLWRKHSIDALLKMFPDMKLNAICSSQNWFSVWNTLQNLLVYNDQLHFVSNSIDILSSITKESTTNGSLIQIFYYDLWDVLAVYLSAKINQDEWTINLELLENNLLKPVLIVAIEFKAYDILEFLLQFNNIKINTIIVKKYLFIDHDEKPEKANQILTKMTNHPSFNITVFDKRELIEDAFYVTFSHGFRTRMMFVDILLDTTSSPYNIPNHFFIVEQILWLCKRGRFIARDFKSNNINDHFLSGVIPSIEYCLSLLSQPLEVKTLIHCLEICVTRSIPELCKLWIKYQTRTNPESMRNTHITKRLLLTAIHRNCVAVAGVLLQYYNIDVVEGIQVFDKHICIMKNTSILAATLSKSNPKMIALILDHISSGLHTIYKIKPVMQMLYLAVDNGIPVKCLHCMKQFCKKHDIKPYFIPMTKK